MTRYIDADSYKNHLEFYQWTLKKFYPNCRGLIARVISLVDDMETVDAVPVIRCKDCKWYEIDEPHRCGYGGHGLRGKSDYCSDAERKDNGAD